MATLHPFRAERFDPARHADLSALAAPPYDVISTPARATLAAASPLNFVHLDLPPGGVDPAGASPFYPEAAERLAGWRRAGDVSRDSAPSFTVLRQRFVAPDGSARSRTGLFGLAHLLPFDAGKVLPHEQTYAGPVRDRAAQMTAFAASLSPVWFVYRGDNGADPLAPFFAAALDGRAPDQRFAMDDTSGELFVLDDPALHQRVMDALGHRPVIIADGHHRYTTTLAHHQRLGTPKPLVFGFFTCLDTPDTLLLATHRGLRAPLAAELDALGRFFDVAPGGGSPAPGAAGAIRFTLCRPGEADRVLTVNAAGAARLAERVPQPELAALDAVAYRVLVLEEALALDAATLDDPTNFAYFGSEADARASFAAGELSALFLLAPMSAAQLGDVTAAGLVTPRKTTYFYPKVPSGLLWHPF